MADITFNPNELILERVFAVEEYNIDTDELYHRYTQPEDSSLKFSADGTDVVDAVGAPIHTFYNAQSGTFDFSNSLFTLDGAEAQFGSRKVVATADRKITVPVSQTITIGSDHTAILKYVPVGVKGSEIKYVKVVNANKTFGKTYLKEANLDIVDVQNALQRPGFQKGEYYIRKMADAFGLTADNMDVDSIKNFADVLTQAGIIMGSTASSASNLSSEVEELLSRASLLSEVTDLDANPIFDSIATADENKNAGDDYVKAITYLKEAKEMYDKGLIGTDDFKTTISRWK